MRISPHVAKRGILPFWLNNTSPNDTCGFHRTRGNLCQPRAVRGTNRPTCGGFAGSRPPGRADFTARGAIPAIMVPAVARIGPRAVVSRDPAQPSKQEAPAWVVGWWFGEPPQSTRGRQLRGVAPDKNKKPPPRGGFGGACCTRRDYMNWLVSFSMVPSAFSFARASLMAAVRAVLSLLTTMAYSSPVAMDLTI